MTRVIETTCCIAGGGPAGMMLGFLLARAGVDVVVLEKHADFLRDFRGDTVHPSTLRLFHELGLLDDFLKLPHSEVRKLSGLIGGKSYRIADFSHVPGPCKFMALVPQWDLLNFLVDKGRKHPKLHVMMRAEAKDIVIENGRVVGIKITNPEGEAEVRARLSVGCDGRHSTVREKAGFQVHDLGAPLDVLWFRLPTKPGEEQTFGRFSAGALLVQLHRIDYWQCALVIPKGSADQVKAEGLAAFRQRVARIAPDLSDRVETIASLDDVKLLTVTVDRLKRWWRPGLICIGDAAHAMSPIGGVGINLAIQDAVAAANILADPLSRPGEIGDDVLASIEDRRTFPTRVTQWVQVTAQNNVIAPALRASRPFNAPWPIKLLSSSPMLQGLPARFVGIGARPEHIRTPEKA